MKVTVCEFSEDPRQLEQDWERLIQNVHTESSQLVLLPEMPFYPWFPRSKDFNPGTWKAVLDAHDTWQTRLAELAPAAVLGTRPVESLGKRLNQAFLWDTQRGFSSIHAKYYLPNEAGFWETNWYQRGKKSFETYQIDHCQGGFMICTELWFQELGRAYSKHGVHLIANPRATQATTREKWLVGGRAAAVVAGAFCLSSNRTSPPGTPFELGGQGWVIDPDGDVLGLTSPEKPFLTIDIALEKADYAKTTYPRYVEE